MKISGLFLTIVGLLFSLSGTAADICPGGSYVGRGPCQICPDGSYAAAGGDVKLRLMAAMCASAAMKALK